MVHHIWSILCEQILVNPINNNFSYINTTNIAVLKTEAEEGKFVSIDPFIVATKWFNESPKQDDEVQIRVSASLLNNNESIIVGETKVTFKNDIYIVSVNMEITNFPIKNKGLYLIKVEYKPIKNKKWKEASSLPLRIMPKLDTDKQKA